jgi:lactoylglutathione lyase
MTTDLKTGHIGLNVTNLERSSNFYRAVLGFETVFESRAPVANLLFWV